MIAFFLWCILFVMCWPLALVALIAYPFVWLLLIPFRLVGIAVNGALSLVWAVVTLPARLLTAPFRIWYYLPRKIRLRSCLIRLLPC